MKFPAKSPDERRIVTDQIPYAWWARVGIWWLGVWDAIRTGPPKSCGRQREVGVGEPGFDESMLILVKRSSYFPFKQLNPGCSIDRAMQTDLHPEDLLRLQQKRTLTEQLIAAKRVIDLDGKPLDLEWFRERVYLVRRVREDSAQLNVSIIDAICSDSTSYQFVAAMKRDFELKYGKEAMRSVTDITSAFPHTRIELLDVGATLAVITPTGLNDFMRKIWTDSQGSFAPHIPDAEIWLIDFSDIDLNGGVGSPERHLVIKNFKGFTK